MRLAPCLTLGIASLWILGCADSDPAVPSLGDAQTVFQPDSVTDAGIDGAPVLPPPEGNTWSYLYEHYFSGTSTAQTPGHCGEGRCHYNLFHGFRCGADGNTCYAGMVGVGIVNPSDPARSRIGSFTSSPLVWVNLTGGVMPLDNAYPNPQAAADILAWLDAGATNDLPPSEAGPEGGDAESLEAGEGGPLDASDASVD